MTELLDRRLHQLERRRRWDRVLIAVPRWWVPVLACAAAGVLLIRTGVPVLAWAAWPVVVAAALVPLAALPRHLGRRGARALVAGELDRLCAAEGLVMALAERSPEERDAGWYERIRGRLERVTWPSLPWRGAAWALLLLAVAGGGAGLPQRQAAAVRPAPPSWVALVDERGAELAALDEAGLVPEPERRDLERELEAVRQHAESGGMDEATWLALDEIDRRLDQQASAAGRRLAEALQAAESLGDADSSLPIPDQAVAELGERLRELAERAPGTVPRFDELGAHAPELERALQQALDHGLQLSPEQLAALRERGWCRSGGNPSGEPADPDRLRAASLALRDRLEREAEGLLRRGLVPAECLRRGGVARGPGHAPLAFSHRDRAEAGTTEALPPGARLNPDGSVTIAETRRDADLDEAALRELQRSAQRSFDPAAADARDAEVAPRHRAAVSAYFAGDPAP